MSGNAGEHTEVEAALVGYLESLDLLLGNNLTENADLARDLAAKDLQIRTIAGQALEMASLSKHQSKTLKWIYAKNTELKDAMHQANAKNAELQAEVERLRVQLAGCGVAADGGGVATRDSSARATKNGDYGWSPAYQAVLDLRLNFEALQAQASKIADQSIARVQRINLARAALQRYREWFKNDLVSHGRSDGTGAGYALRLDDIDKTLAALNG